MIRVAHSPTADSRSCDFAAVSKEQLQASSELHIADVQRGLKFFARMIERQAAVHDIDKLSAIDEFHEDFRHGFKDGHTRWLEEHYSLNRHHLNAPDGVPDDVNLIDVLDFIADVVMAARARTGRLTRPIEIDPTILEQAFNNTVRILYRAAVVVGGPALVTEE
jgi:hypothetical protein